MNAMPVLFPLLNPNEPEALLAAVHVSEGQQVRAGDLLFSLETTKSAADVVAEQDGWVAGLRFQVGDTVRAGEVACYLADSEASLDELRDATEGFDRLLRSAATLNQPSSQVERLRTSQPVETSEDAQRVPTGLRITKPALELARRHNLDLSALSGEWLVTEAQVRKLLDQAAISAIDLPEGPFDPAAILIYGSGGHGKMLLDLLRAQGGYPVTGFIDDGVAAGTRVMGVPVLGGEAALVELHQRGLRLACNAVGGIGDVKVRMAISERLAAAGYTCPALVHPSAFVEPSAHLEAGAQVLAKAYVGSMAELGEGVIANTGSIISHDCALEPFAIISPGAILAGEVRVGSGALVGMGATVNLGVRIGAYARIGNGATVKADVPERAIVRAGAIWPA